MSLDICNDGKSWTHWHGSQVAEWKHVRECQCGKPDGSLTFAEAMALDPSEAEARWAIASDEWHRLDNLQNHETTIRLLKGAHYRRRVPKRSRVQEIGATGIPPVNGLKISEFYADLAIRSVIEYLNRNGYGDCNIEREFLEPR